jgi:hypothetical protein
MNLLSMSGSRSPSALGSAVSSVVAPDRERTMVSTELARSAVPTALYQYGMGPLPELDSITATTRLSQQLQATACPPRIVSCAGPSGAARGQGNAALLDNPKTWPSESPSTVSLSAPPRHSLQCRAGRHTHLQQSIHPESSGISAERPSVQGVSEGQNDLSQSVTGSRRR